MFASRERTLIRATFNQSKHQMKQPRIPKYLVALGPPRQASRRTQRNEPPKTSANKVINKNRFYTHLKMASRPPRQQRPRPIQKPLSRKRETVLEGHLANGPRGEAEAARGSHEPETKFGGRFM